MRRLIAGILTLGLMVGTAVAGDNPVSLDINLGYTGIGSKDNPAKVSEYDSAKSYPSGEIKGKVNAGALDGSFGVYYYTKDDKNFIADFSLGRVFKIGYSYDSFIHRLQHDYMEKGMYYGNFTFGTTVSGVNGATIRGLTAANPVFNSMSLAPGSTVAVPGIQSLLLEDLSSTSPDKNMIRRSKTKFDVEMTLPFFSYVKPYFSFEQEVRQGWHQAFVMIGKCAPCHDVAETSRIDERTRDITLGAKFNWNFVSVDYSHTWRTFDNRRDGMPSLNYDKYTGGISFMMADRIIYGNNQTYPIYYDEIPDIERHTDKVVARLDLPFVTTAVLQGYWDTTRNNYTDKQYTSSSYAIRLVNKSIDGLTLSLTGRYYNINNDDVKVKMTDLANYPTINTYGGIPVSSFDYTRKSILDRDVYEAKFDFSYKLAKNYTLTGNYQYKRIERDNSVWKDYWTPACYNGWINGQVQTVCLDDERFLKDDTTQIHNVKLALSGRPIEKVNFRLSYMYQYVDDPLTSKSVGLEYQQLGPNYPYVFFYNLEKRGYGSNIAKDTHEVKLYTTWNPIANLIASLDLSYRYEKNDDVENDYKLDRYYAGLTVSYMPIEKLTVNLGSIFDYTKTQQKLFVDAYRACAGSTFGSQGAGSVYDDVDYKMYNWVTYLSLDYQLLKNFKVFADLSYTYSKAYSDSPNYPTPGTYPLTSDYLLWPDVNYTGGQTSIFGSMDGIYYLMTFDPTHLKNLDRWTELKYNIFEASLGFDWTLYKNLGLKVTGIYRYVNDDTKYLGENLDGKQYGVSAYLTYKF